MFRTEFDIDKAGFQIDYEDKILSMGSCFAQNMGQRLDKLKFNITNNPFGILYNPISISNGLEHLSKRSQFKLEGLFQQNDCWHSWSHHSAYSDPDPALALSRINASIKAVPSSISTLVLTFGTAYAYRLKTTGNIVANCHKVPAAAFDKIRLSPNEIVDSILERIAFFQAKYPSLKTILTVSPIRHIRDGVLENQRSKAILLLACERIVEQASNAYYFPSYEIMMDDLRDYRFYASDMLHPSQQAQDYIWNKFQSVFFEPETNKVIQAIAKLQLSLAHRPLQPKSEAHQKFLHGLFNKLTEMERQLPKLDFGIEKRKLEELLP